MKKKSILIQNDLIYGGGVEKVMYNLANYLLKKKYKVFIATLNGTKKDFYKIFPKSISFIQQEKNYMKLTRILPKKISNKINAFIQRFKNSYYSRKNFFVAIAIKEGESAKKVKWYSAEKYYAWIHVDFSFMHWTTYLFESTEDERLFLKGFDKTVCVSNTVLNSVISAIGNTNNLCVRYNPINYKDIIKKSQLNCETKRDTSKLLFVALGRLDKCKQYDMLVEVCSQLSLKYDFELWIIGEGKQREKIEKIIKDFSLSNVRLLGNQENPYPLVKQADCFISSAEVESYGLAIQEALILKVPVLSLYFPALDEVFDERFGMVVPNDKSSLSYGLEKILLNPNLLDDYKLNIENYFRYDTLWENRLDEICNLWS